MQQLPATTAPRGFLRDPRRAAIAGTLAFAVVFVAGETYAKWWPYAHKVAAAVDAQAVKGTSILSKAGAATAGPSWHGAWSFLTAYGLDIWIALVAGILIGAGVEVLLPRRVVARTFSTTSAWRASLAGGVLALPCLMCTCCGSPVTVGLRRADAPVAGALSYWLGNPLLNPVVLVLLAIALPWEFVVVRILVGALIVFAAAPIVSRLAARRRGGAVATDGAVPARLQPATDDSSPAPSLARYLRAVARLAAYLLPEYFLVVLFLGAFRGWLLPVGHEAATWGFAAVVVAAVGGTILVIPTAAEIPIILGLLALGLPRDVTGTLLIALPALSLASMAMVGRWLSWRVTLAAAGVVAALSIVAGLLVAAL